MTDAAKPAALPPAESIFEVLSPQPSDSATPRRGRLLGLATPCFTHLTSRGLPQCLRPEVLESLFEGELLYELPASDLLLRQDAVSNCPKAVEGCRGFWPMLRKHMVYSAFRNPRNNPSVHGGDAVCSVETSGGRRKVGPKEILEMQRVMRADLVAAPGEEVGLDVMAARRGARAVARAAEWLKEILEAKASSPHLNFPWHVLASIQGGGEVKLRQKACEEAATMPVAGYWIGGLGYSEDLASRAQILQTVAAALPTERPRFLPLCLGTPIEVLQGILYGVDVFELTYPAQAAQQGIALTFTWEMPEAECGSGDDKEQADIACLLAQQPDGEDSSSKPRSELPAAVRQMLLKSEEFREDFSPISQDSPVKQYSRAYLYHLHEVRELLGTMLLAQHNFYVYRCFFEAIRGHIERGSLRRFVAWFLRTQTCELPAMPEQAEQPGKRARKR
eukprot:TRINITY_DN25162_c0_g1_i1.p1 TRINITY_DN25162_c0_g1~~TRINITY_DN25162_c0_g1_i1.p1  ORF type:complete len:460 (-),score=80.81 TRINITY_DN25162_c0_g1_i1:39-1382(-)